MIFEITEKREREREEKERGKKKKNRTFDEDFFPGSRICKDPLGNS